MEGTPLEARLQEAYRTSLKARDATTVAALRLVLTALQNARVAKKQQPLTEDEMFQVLRREMKKRQESIEAFTHAGRAEQAAEEQAQAGVLQRFLPAQLDANAVAAVVDSIIAATQPAGPADFGRVMKAAMQELKGKADGKIVQTLIQEKLRTRAA